MSVNNWKDNYLRPAAIGMRELDFPKYCADCGGRTKLKSLKHIDRIVCYECVVKEKAATALDKFEADAAKIIKFRNRVA